METFPSVLSIMLFLSLVGHQIPPSMAAIGVNWGTQASHRLPGHIVVQMLKDNNFTMVKLFDTDPDTLSALAGTDLDVMVAIPNLYLQDMTDMPTARAFVERNISRYIFQGGVNIRYVAVGNEPFLSSYNGSFVNITYPALQNVQAALTEANLADKIKVTVPMNADVLDGKDAPSQGTFRANIAPQMKQIVDLLAVNGCPYTVNIYPFISYFTDSNFPQNYLYFDSNIAQVVDGTRTYTNTFDASYDTVVAALAHMGYTQMPIIVGEVGWPTDGYIAATPQNAQRFNQGFLNRITSNPGTPARPGVEIDYYLFGLLDENLKSVAPGNFERHWGVFNYDGTAKYPLTVPGAPAGENGTLVNAKGVEYLSRRWCVLSESADLLSLQDPVSFACQYSDCTELGYGGSCNGQLDARGNASYAFNQYFQMTGQQSGSCNFNGLAVINTTDPSVGTCKFIVQINANGAVSLRHLIYSDVLRMVAIGATALMLIL